jgi:phage/plasmid-associated DNA primase
MSATDAVDAYAALGLVAFSVDIRWDPAAKRGAGGKSSVHPRAWQTAGGKKRPDWNSVAINTGLSGLVVVDFDSDASLEAFRAEAASRGVDVATRAARSGSGRGGHLYFRAVAGDPPLRSVDNVPLWGIVDPASGSSKIDVKAAGGLIYAPPSSYRMPDGSARRYEWVDASVGFADLPRELLECLPRAASASASETAPRGSRASSPAPASLARRSPAPKTHVTRTKSVSRGSERAEPALDSEQRETPLGAEDVLKLVAALKPERSAGERCGDWLRVGFAMKHNERLLRDAGRSLEADLMPTFFDVFSARCPGKYPGRDAILKEFAGFRPDRPGGTSVTVASLVAMAREDSSASAAALEEAESAEESVKALVAARAGCSPSEVRLSVPKDAGSRSGAGAGKRIDLATPSGSGYVDSVDLAMFIDPSQKEMLGAAHDGDGSIQLPSDFASTAKKHFKDFKRGQQLEYHRDNRDVARVRPRGAEYPLVRVMDPHTTDTVVRYTPASGAVATQLRDSEVSAWNRDLADAIAVSCRAALGDATYGAFVNYGTVNNNIMIVAPGPGSKQRRHKGELCDLIASSDPCLIRRLKYVPGAGPRDGRFFHCSPENNMWSQATFTQVRSLVVLRAAAAAGSLSPQELTFINEHELDVVHAFGQGHCRDDTFEQDKLDADPLLFAMKNKVLDLRDKTFARPEPEHHIGASAAPWDYDEELAALHRPDAESFFASLVPVPEERELLLAYFSNMLCGLTDVKALMVLNDERGGHNGKSTAIQVILGILGERTPGLRGGYAYKDKTAKRDLFLQTASAGAHDSNMRVLQGARAVVKDEFSESDKLDTALLRDLVSGTTQERAGRICGQDAFFSFRWQGKLLFSFNAGSQPDMGNVPELYRRIVVAPFRSKFVRDPAQVDPLTYTFLEDPQIEDKLPLWRSAILDMLVERFDGRREVILSPPASTVDWRRKLEVNDNPLAEWLEASVKVTGVATDIVSQAELLELIRAPGTGWRDASRHKARKIKEFLKNWCSSKKVYWGDGLFTSGAERIHQVHGKGIQLTGA